MPRVRFQTVCPACKNAEVYFWSCNCGGDLYLDNNAYLMCDKCDAGNFIFRRKFDCGNRKDGAHSGGYEYGCYQGFLACLSSLGKSQNPPAGFITDVIGVLMQHKDEFNENY